jgi:hypothetical protein
MNDASKPERLTRANWAQGDANLSPRDACLPKAPKMTYGQIAARLPDVIAEWHRCAASRVSLAVQVLSPPAELRSSSGCA